MICHTSLESQYFDRGQEIVRKPWREGRDVRLWCADLWKAGRDTVVLTVLAWCFWLAIDLVVAHAGTLVLLGVCSGTYVWRWRRTHTRERNAS